MIEISPIVMRARVYVIYVTIFVILSCMPRNPARNTDFHQEGYFAA